MPTSRNRKKKKLTKKKRPHIQVKKIQETTGIAPAPIKMGYFEGSLNETLGGTFEERLNKLRQMGKEAADEFPAKYQALRSWFGKYDQLQFLSFGAYYFMTAPAGYDEEAVTGTLEFPPHFQELLQAFALTLPRTYDPRPFSKEVDKFKKEFREIGDLIKLKHFNFPETVKNVKDVHTHMLRTEMMLNTTAVRNWSYEHKMKTITLDLAMRLGKNFEDFHGFNPVAFLNILYRMTDEVQERINKHRSKTAAFVQQKSYNKIMDAYEAQFPVIKSSPAGRKEIWEGMGKDLQSLKAMFLMHSDLFLEQILTFDFHTLESYSNGQITAEKLKYIFEQISWNFGDLTDCDVEHFLLGNPVHERPFIYVTDDTVFSSLWSVMTHLSIGLLENFCWKDDKLIKKYSSVRADYLEEQVANLFKTSFPMAQICRGSKWKGNDGKENENDLIVIIDKFALIVESKAGMISPPAKRGAPERLFKTLEELIEKPSQQALSFIDFLKDNPSNLSLKVKKGPNNRFDASKIKYYIPLGVTLSHLGVMGTNLKHLIRAGVSKKKIEELATSISLTDLQVVFDLLPFASEKIHYLQRRRELEASVEYIGDELDLLAWYLDSGFNLGKDWEKFGLFKMDLKSKELDNYIIGSANHEAVTKPELKKTLWWKDMLQRLEEKQMTTWLESSYVLLNVPLDIQEEFENLVNDLKRKMLEGKAEHSHNWILLLTSEKKRQFAIASYCYCDRLQEGRNDIIGDILYDDNVKDVKGKLVIGLNIDKTHYPYSVLGCWLSSGLFDDKFLPMLRD